MTGPEHLEAGPPSRPGARRRGRWVLPAAGVVLLGVVLAVRVGELPDRPAPAPGPATSAPSTTAPGQPGASEPDVPGRAWAADLRAGTGTLYLTAGRSVLAVDASTGLVTDTGVRTRSYDARLAPLAEGLLVWYPSGWSSRLLRFGLDTGTAPPGALARANRFVPAAGDGVWATQVDPGRPAARTVWRLVDAEGTATTSVAVRGRAVADGSGGLLAVAGGTVRVVEPPLPSAADRQADAGAVVATGPDGFLVQRCSGGVCTTVLREGAGRARRVLDVPVAGSAVDGALSPGNRLVLLSQLVDDAPVVQVRPLGSDRPLRTFPGAGSGAVWLSDRWVAFVGRDGLVLYDAVDDRVVPSRLTGVTRLAWQPV